MNGTTFLTVTQAAEELGISRQAVQLMVDDKRIHALWIMERWAIPEAEVERIRAERKPVRNGKQKAA